MAWILSPRILSALAHLLCIFIMVVPDVAVVALRHSGGHHSEKAAAESLNATAGAMNGTGNMTEKEVVSIIDAVESENSMIEEIEYNNNDNKERPSWVYEGLLYVKHGRVGSRSEGPDYYLQTIATDGSYYGETKDLLLKYKDRFPFDRDYALEYYNSEMVHVEGKFYSKGKDGVITLEVESIRKILSNRIPHPPYDP